MTSGRETEGTSRSGSTNVNVNVKLVNGQVWQVDASDEGVIGRGRFGVVRRCRRCSDGTVAVCKAVAMPSDPFDAECVATEVKITQYLCTDPSSSALHHAVVRSYGLRSEGAEIWTVMEMCSGGDLFDRIAANNAAGTVFSEAEAAAVMRQLMSALAFCHARGVAHRDVKPDNILFVDPSSGRVKIADFGQAAFFGGRGGGDGDGDGDGDGNGSITGVVGTPYYVAPEVLFGEYTEKVDVWSAGVVLYMMLCGMPPFRGESVQDIFNNVLRGRLCFRFHMSASVRSLLRLMLHRDPGTRLSAAQVLEHEWLINN